MQEYEHLHHEDFCLLKNIRGEMSMFCTFGEKKKGNVFLGKWFCLFLGMWETGEAEMKRFRHFKKQ